MTQESMKTQCKMSLCLFEKLHFTVKLTCYHFAVMYFFMVTLYSADNL